MVVNNAIISLHDIGKSFGAFEAVRNVNFTIERGEFFSLLGPSGCGKTTLLRMLAGLEQPTTGNIYIDGESMAGVPANLRPTNMVFQSYAIMPHLNVRENIAYGLRRLKLSKAELAQRVNDALSLIKLDGYGERAAHQLSGGQRQRVALARALVCQPKVLLLDEPLGALDKKLREEMQIELRQIQRTVGITFVFVTHDQEEALTMSDRIAVMSRGETLQIDTVTRLYEAPNCREVAEFIGTMNFIEGKLVGAQGGAARVDAGALGIFDVAYDAELPGLGTPVLIAIRPEKLNLARSNSRRAANSVAGRIAASVYLGDRNHFLVKIDGLDRPFAVALQNSARVLGEVDRNEAQVWLTWPAEAGVLLVR